MLYCFCCRTPNPTRIGGESVFEFLFSIVGTITGGVICHYIIKWLDSSKSDK